MSDGNGSVDRIAREYEEFYAQGDFAHYSRRISTNVFRTLMKKAGVHPGASILDLGCGTGFYSSIMADLGYMVVGVDISATAIDQAKKRDSRCDFRVGDAWEFQYDSGSFDCIVLSGCSILNTNDLHRIKLFLENILRYLPQGGKIVIIQHSNLSGLCSSFDTWFNHTWQQISDYVPDQNAILRFLALSHFRIVSLLGVFGLGWLITQCLRGKFLKNQRHIFQIIEKI